jgi:hypothetical protein
MVPIHHCNSGRGLNIKFLFSESQELQADQVFKKYSFLFILIFQQYGQMNHSSAQKIS